MATPTEILALCQRLRCQTSDEKQIQDALEPMLREICSTVEREKRLSDADVVDFLVENHIAIEVKTEGSWMAVTRQLQRYMEHPSVHRLILVTTRRKHVASVPGTLRGKPVDVAWLSPF
jgi:hypothetical protein